MGPVDKIVKDGLDNMDVPMTIMDSGICDASVTSIDDIQHRLDVFFEILEERIQVIPVDGRR